jgi:uncharacterized phiE125 gp8 family phage protein
MALKLVTPPASEPVSLEEAKLHLRVDFNDDDALIQGVITAARAAAETITGRQLVTARWKASFDRFCVAGPALLIHKSPVQSIISVQYMGTDDDWHTMPGSDYVVDLNSEPVRIAPAFGKVWPTVLPQIGSVIVTFDAGYGDAAAVPEGIKSWIKLRVGSLYAHREEVSRTGIASLPFVDGLLDPYKVAFV